jgi:putative DNA primase/helicase
MSARAIARALAGHEVKAHRGNYQVCCPAHDDCSPSLSLRDGSHGPLTHCFAGCAPGEVFAAIRRKGLKLDPNESAKQPTQSSIAYERQQHEKARWLWSRRKPISGTIAETYLRTARGIACPLPPTLGFLPAYGHHLPALIAAFALPQEIEPGVIAPPREVHAVHLIALQPDGLGKANLAKPKITIGSPEGYRSYSRRPDRVH